MDSLTGCQGAPGKRRPQGWDPNRVFLSHAASDKARFVDELYRRLRSEALDVWYDSHELLGGDIQDEKILDEDLPSCGVFVSVLSENSQQSAYVAQEIAVADGCRRDRHCKIILVVLDDAEVPRRLRPTHYIKIADTDSFDAEFEKLVRSIRAASRDLAARLPDVSDYVGVNLPLPPDPFFNREKELAALDGALRKSRERTLPRAAVLAGLPGAGKSALAAQWANAIAGDFDDPALRVDFLPRGRSVVPDIEDIVGGLVRHLGGPEAVPARPADAIPTYRRLTSHKRLLLLAENVTQPAQLAQIMPPGPGSLVVATTTAFFDTTGEQYFDLPPIQELSSSDAAEMLRAFAGPRDRDEPREDWEQLAHACGCLPIALAVCGARLRDRPTWSVRFLLEDLRRVEAPFSALIGDADSGPMRVFEHAYRDFDAEAQSMYCRLGSFRGSTLTVPTAAALSGQSPSDAERILDMLFAHGMLIERAPRRYQIHPIVHEHMRSAFERHESTRTSEECVVGLLEWYLGAARRIDRAIAPERLRIDADDELRPRDDIPRPGTPAEANQWYLAERENIIAVLEDAADLGAHRHVWRMAEALWLPQSNMRLFADWIACSRSGAVAARECGNAAAEARLLSHLARAYAEQGCHERAREEMRSADRCLDTVTHPLLEASITEFRGSLALLEGELRLARKHFARARRQMSRLGNVRGAAIANMYLARAHNARGARRRAHRVAKNAIRGFRKIGDSVNEAKADLSRVRALTSTRRPMRALDDVCTVIAALKREGLRFDEAQAHELAHRVIDCGGDQDCAHLRQAFQIYRKLGHARAEQLEPLVCANSAER